MKLNKLGKTGLIVGGVYATNKALNFVFDFGKAWMLANVYALYDEGCDDIDEIKETYKEAENGFPSRSERRRMKRINKLAESCYNFQTRNK